MIYYEKTLGNYFIIEKYWDNDFTIKNVLDNDFTIKMHWTMILL